ncbi:MAG: hypothetical protein M1492_00860 [Gammaproteobacteria bacterium]|nr:hypothetical protein [Gammaproteobacteria bacterium]
MSKLLFTPWKLRSVILRNRIIMVEAAAVSSEGRISPDDLGIWNDAQGDALRARLSNSSKNRERRPPFRLPIPFSPQHTTPSGTTASGWNEASGV